MFHVLKSQLKSYVLPWKIKIILHKALIRSVLTYASKIWILSTSEEKVIAIFKRKVLKPTYDAIKDSNKWRIRYNYELHPLYEDMDIITFIKVEGLSGLVMLFEKNS
jgi:hypothetical protein